MKKVNLGTSVKWQYADTRQVPDIREKVLDEINIPNGLILEIGCADGNFFELLLNKGFKAPNYYYTGIDIDKSQISKAKRMFPTANFVNGNILDSKFDDIIREASLIISFQVLEHIYFDIGLLNKIDSGKSIIYSVPDFDYGSKNPNGAGHKRSFDLEGWSKRYENILDISEVWTVEHIKKRHKVTKFPKKIFLFQTTKR